MTSFYKKAIHDQELAPFFIDEIGDDLTDEDAFKAIKDNGLGILVRKKYRNSAADVWLQPPDQLMQFLNYWYILFNTN